MCRRTRLFYLPRTHPTTRSGTQHERDSWLARIAGSLFTIGFQLQSGSGEAQPLDPRSPVHRRRPLQERQRHVRPRGGRPVAQASFAAPGGMRAQRRYGRPPERRRVRDRADSSECPRGRGHRREKIVDVLNTPFQLEGAELFVTASIGITVFPTDSTEQDTLIRNADVAMYRAKERGRNNYQFYTPEMNRRTREMLNMEGELRRALERDEFVLHYQPKVSLTTGHISGVEALLRWRHPSAAWSRRGFHTAARGDRADRAGRGLGVARRVPAAQSVAAGRHPAVARGDQPVGAAVPRTRPWSEHPSHTRRTPGRGGAARGRDHRERGS